MKGKFLVIILLVVLLVFIINKMMKYEQSIREERIVTNYIEDETKPLFTKIGIDEIRQIEVQYNFKCGSTYFQKYNNQNNKWENIFLKGVNLGVAVPGKFPAEFSLSFNEYLNWLEMIGKMNANIIRLYTILPPDFYKALAYYNLHNYNKAIYIMQGVWAKIPEDDNYYNQQYSREFRKEIIDAIEVIHGNAVLKPERGKAHGTYSVDISQHVIAFLLGREWEPKIVYNTIRKNSSEHYQGDFVSINNGNPMEVWLAQMMDFTVLYETQTYRQQHPLSFVNWLPLDPMYHNTEIIENKKVREYDNDLNDIDFRKYNATELFYSGIYAAYHAYPYYPDYIYLQENYANAKNHKGVEDNFYGYLKDLKQHTEGIPLVIAEYGLPTSRGVSHFTPSGFNQGGHSEAKQAELSLTLTQDIYETNCAGAIYFEWADEWFKHNWLVMDFEIPFHNRKLWHNMENPEQNFGILALENKKKTIDASLDDWKNNENIEEIKNITVYTNADATYFYWACKLPDFNFDKNNLYIAIDTYDEQKGDHKLPFSKKYFVNGFEFLCELKSKDNAKILIDDSYSVFTDIYNDYIPVYASKYNENGVFIDQLMLVNRGRETLLGNLTDSILNNRSALTHGNSTKPEFSNADWCWSDEKKVLELRLDWHLLNVSDPSKKYVLNDKLATKTIEASKTEGFNFYFFVTDKKNNIIKQYPEDYAAFYSWDEWDYPDYTERLKPIYDTLKTYFQNLKPKNDTNFFENIYEENFEILKFYNDKDGAVSLTFDNAAYSQFQYALPTLNKYNVNANFSYLPGLLDDMSISYNIDENVKLRRLGLTELKKLINFGNEITLQCSSDNVDINDLFIPQINRSIQILHIHKKEIPDEIPDEILFVRASHENAVLNTKFAGIDYTVAKTNISQTKLDSLLRTGENKWTIFAYHNLYKDSTEISKISNEEIIKDAFISEETFKRQIRLIRNNNYWIAPESNVFKYLLEKKLSDIETIRYGNVIFLTITNSLNQKVFRQPLTIEFTTDAKIIKITDSASDGIYTNRTGSIIFNAYPNSEVRVEIISY